MKGSVIKDFQRIETRDSDNESQPTGSSQEELVDLELQSPRTDFSINPIGTRSENQESQEFHELIEEGKQSIFENLSIPPTRKLKQIWAVAGGKGGVGKSLLASSISISLARSGHRVVAIDLDLGGSNLHTTLGVDLPKQSLSDFFSGRVNQLEKCIVSSGIPRLDLISGAQDAVGVTQIGLQHKVKLLEKINELDTDYVVIDLGAGTSYNTLDFFLFSDLGFIVLLPEPTSIENAYRFIKSSYYRRLWHSRHIREIRPLIEIAMDSKNTKGIKSPADLFQEVSKNYPEAGIRLKQEIQKFRPKLIVNQARTQADIDIGFSVKAVCKKYFGVDLDYVGYLDYDSAVWQSVRRKRPLMIEFPNSKLVSSVDRITHYLIKRCFNQKSEMT